MAYTSNQLLFAQKIIKGLDVRQCKALARWLSHHITTLEIDDALFKINIQQLKLSTRAYNVLMDNNIYTIGQLLKTSTNWDNIRKLRGAGEKVLQELSDTINRVREGQYRRIAD
ncbi:hypothetical protein FAM09_13945 [Niastella caeni]|uniref:RNA polymerase alpha subunit C-terminal domain-containing protein n=1 Tax=Niastella caeni TaxID=2569763 RepID=A0A4S8HXR9_9BACT|nr:DNA-directed RNA polymerase subunit alpha C-terminal domain-containing protein [Niastella caeni]THU39599.1 hypothetical protein FAM09_13945 [Niastella caeni]